MNETLIAYIKPGEFTFCGRCGHTCKPGCTDFMCVKCQITLLGLDETDERFLTKVYERHLTDLTSRFREELGHVRIRADETFLGEYPLRKTSHQMPEYQPRV